MQDIRLEFFGLKLRRLEIDDFGNADSKVGEIFPYWFSIRTIHHDCRNPTRVWPE
jgi:hypothetical protein